MRAAREGQAHGRPRPRAPFKPLATDGHEERRATEDHQGDEGDEHHQ
jgi:hypothetical protein